MHACWKPPRRISAPCSPSWRDGVTDDEHAVGDLSAEAEIKRAGKREEGREEEGMQNLTLYVLLTLQR